MQNANARIEAQMQLYFDGLYFSDTARLGRVFAPEARYICATEDEVINLGMEDYFALVARREPPAERQEERRDEIVSIAQAGERTALVTAHCAIGDRYFTDFLSFIRVADSWQIVAKVFHYNIEPRPVSAGTE